MEIRKPPGESPFNNSYGHLFSFVFLSFVFMSARVTYTEETRSTLKGQWLRQGNLQGRIFSTTDFYLAANLK